VNATVTKTILVHEHDIDVAADFTYTETSSRESHECFGNRSSTVETESHFDSWDGGVYLKGALPESIDAELAAKIEAHIESLDPDDLWEHNDCIDAIE